MFMTFYLSCDPSFVVPHTISLRCACLYVGVTKTGPPYWHFFRPRRKKIGPFSFGHSGRPSEESKGFLLAFQSARPSRRQGSHLALYSARPSREQGPPLTLHSARPSREQGSRVSLAFYSAQPSREQGSSLALHSARPSREQGSSRALHSARPSREQGSGVPRLVGP